MQFFKALTSDRYWIGFLVALAVVAFLVRWYQLPQKLFFGFEQGRDALIINDIRHLDDFVLVGPKTDLGGIFHGAWYYYLMVVPYGLGNGNPLAAALFLVFLSSTVPVVMAITLFEMTKSKATGAVAGILSVASFELISYSQWLSNVTPAVPLMAICLWSLWRLHVTNRQRYWIISCLSAILAAQFEIILCLWFAQFFVLLLLTKVIRWPQLKTILIIAVGGLIVFAPMILFNLRNEFVTIKAVTGYQSGQEELEKIPFLTSVIDYGLMLERLVTKSLWYVPSQLALVLVLITIWAASRRSLATSDRSPYILLGLWTIMTWPVIFFPHSIRLTQLFVGSALGLIGLTSLAFDYFNQLKWGRVVLFGVGAIWIYSTAQILYLLHTNQDVFYRTIQDDLNYRDQLALLTYVNDDAAGQPYRLKAFTIPYFQEEGWRYLHQYWYPTATENGAVTIYVVIEEKVDPYWIKTWTGELGPTELVEEKWFGKLRVQKRRIGSSTNASDSITL